MPSGKSIVRQEVEKITGVNRTWFEHESYGDSFKKILVVEVSFDTDPESHSFQQSILEDISREVAHVLANHTTMMVGGMRIVPA